MGGELKEYSTSTVSWILAIQSFVLVFGGIIVGPLFDILGPKPLLIPGILLLIIGVMTTSVASEYYQFILAQGICTGLGGSLIFNTTVGALSTWFVKRRATAVGIMTSGAAIGGTILPIIFRRIEAAHGFSQGVRAVGYLLAGLSVFVCFAISSRTKPPGWKHANFYQTYVKPFRWLPYTTVTAAVFFVYFGAYIPLNYVPQYARNEAQFSSTMASYLASVQNGASTIGRIVPGILADRLGRYNVFTVCTVIAGILTLTLWIPANSHAVVIAYAALYGLFAGPTMSLFVAMIGEIVPVQHVGARLGATSAVVSFASLCGVPLAGGLLGANHDKYWAMAVFSALCMFMAAFLAFLTKLMVTDRQWRSVK
ncbi:major facilitator superfamily domain-containing protein [Limtongia smithiae]|uniref:major facilitator superfamily domain-containing protein n=1 Tax=Limtongia smithiae TaxID=1125753 RepID=UPI0034CD215D